MRQTRTLAAAALLYCLHASAQDRGFWKPVSTTARAITGEIGITSEKLTINFSSFTIADIRALTPEESAATFNLDAGGAGTLYRLSIPANKVLLHRNVMCGAEETQWMATYALGKTLQVAFFSGSKMPVFTREAVANTTTLCGTFLYSR